jgi:hypothetical protein
MRHWRPRIALGLVAIFAGRAPVDAAVVYKWTDADGVVHFSDQSAPGAERILTSSGSSRSGTAPSAANTIAASAKPKPPAAALTFSEFSIASPGHEETITGNQPVNVHLAMEPELRPAQALTWTLNGSALANQANATQFTLEDLPRGTYTLIATVEDQPSGETKSSEPVTFYVVRTSLFSPKHKTAP